MEALLAAPVLAVQTVSHVEMTILLFPQNRTLEIFAQSMLLMLSFWF